MGILDPKTHSRGTLQNIDKEIQAFRTEIRASAWLSNPEKQEPLKSLSGCPLDPGLQHLCKTAREQRSRYVENYLLYELDADKKKAHSPTFAVTPVFVTAEERKQFDSIEKKSAETICCLTFDNIKTITDDEVREALETTLHEMSSSKKQPTKAKLLAFFYEVEQYKNEQDTLPPSEADSEAVIGE